MWFGTKNPDLVVGIKIQDPLTQTKKLEDQIGTKIYTIESNIENLLLIKNLFPRIRIRDLEWITKIPYSRSLCELDEIVESRIIGQILDLKYPVADSYATTSVVNVVNGESMDESRTCLLASICTFYLFIETMSNRKKNTKRALANWCNVSTTHVQYTMERYNKPLELVSKNQYCVLQTTWLFLEIT